MSDINRLFEKAEKLLQRQKFESALEVYLEILKKQPQDEEVLIILGDLSLKLNRISEGLRFQSQLADQYIRRGDHLKAIVTCRRILKLSPRDLATLIKLAMALERAEKNSEALDAYREAATLCRDAGADAQALECLKRIAVLEPNNPEAQAELAERAVLLNQVAVAAPAFLRAAQLVRAAGQEDRWAEYAEKAYSLDPRDGTAAIEFSEILLKRDRPVEVIGLLEPVLQVLQEDLKVVEFLARAYLATGDFLKAEPLCWKLYKARPDFINLLLQLLEVLAQAGKVPEAFNLAIELKKPLFETGKRDEFLRCVEKIYEADASNVAILETLRDLYDELNKEDGLRRALTRLFSLYLAGEEYDKAADALERILDVDLYGAGHYDRLLNLEGHIDKALYRSILTRVRPASASRGPMSTGTKGEGGVSQQQEDLEALIVEGEMFYRYQLDSKLRETVEKLSCLYPGVEERNSRLRELYDLAGFRPKPVPGAAASETEGGPASARTQTAQSLEELRRISEITSNINREGTPQGVMQVAVNEIGRVLKASRCWGALGSPERPPTLTVEFCSPSIQTSETASALRLYSALIREAVANPEGWSVGNAGAAPVLLSIQDDVRKLEIQSVLALPLLDKDEVAGLLVAEQCYSPRLWTAGESLLLKALAPQIVTAVNNSKLRRLVRSLAGTDPETGLLPRSSYMDCLLAEAQRAKEQSQALSVCLLEPENAADLMKTLGETGGHQYFTRLSKIVTSAVRQNDIAIRYSPFSIALIFPDTPLPQAGLAIEKLRRNLSHAIPDKGVPPSVCAAVCEITLGAEFDAVDGITEVINRLERVLTQAREGDGKRLLLSRFEG